MKLVLRWIITGVALFAAAWIVPGIRVDGDGWIVYAVMAVVLGLANAFIRPLLKALTCSLIVLTLGLFTLVINALTLWLSAWVAQNLLGVGFYVNDFMAAFWGALIVSIVSVLLNVFVRDPDKHSQRKRN